MVDLALVIFLKDLFGMEMPYFREGRVEKKRQKWHTSQDLGRQLSKLFLAYKNTPSHIFLTYNSRLQVSEFC